MKTCKDCIHLKVCDERRKNNHTVSQSVCKNFKNKEDVQEIVRCKDCFYHDTCFIRLGTSIMHSEYGYCSRGTKKNK